MKLGDFFVEIGIQADKKSIQAVEEHITALKKLHREVKREIQLEKELAEATTEEQKARIRKKYEVEKQIDAEEENIKQQKASISNFKGMVKGALGVVGAISLVIGVIDKMTMSLARNNQRLMNFQHQTGISISTLNKYAQANVTANPLATIEGTASSLQNVASNLWDIQLGRGDVSAYQELSYFSGQQVEPYGKSLEEVIESVRSALRKIPNDVQATNLIQRMGFSPDDLMMLRMTRAEFEETQKVFLSAEQRKELEKYGKELNLINLQLKLIKDQLVLKIFPSFNRIMKTFILPVMETAGNLLQSGVDLLNKYPLIIKGIELAIAGLLIKFKPLWALLTGIMLIIDDLVHYFTGGGSVLGVIMKAIHGDRELSEKLQKPDKFFLGAMNVLRTFLPDNKIKDELNKVHDQITNDYTSQINNDNRSQISNDNRNNTFNFYGMNNNQLFPLMSSVTGYNYGLGG